MEENGIEIREDGQTNLPATAQLYYFKPQPADVEQIAERKLVTLGTGTEWELRLTYSQSWQRQLIRVWRPLDGRWVDSGFAAWPVPSEGQGRIAFGIYWSDNKPKKEGLAKVIIEDINIHRL